LLRQSEYNQRLKAAAPLMEAALRWLANHTPGSAEMLRLMDATPVPCSQSVITAKRPARKDEKTPRPFTNWLRQRIEAIIWTLKNQLGLERHAGRVPAGLCARIIQRLLALNTVIWFNWQIGAPVKRSLIAYDH
jgi:hypothetical protein